MIRHLRLVRPADIPADPPPSVWWLVYFVAVMAGAALMVASELGVRL